MRSGERALACGLGELLVLFAAATLAAFVVPVAVWEALERRRARIRNSIIESGQVIGALVQIASPVGWRGRAEIGGYMWHVRDEGRLPLVEGQAVTVVGVEGAGLVVRALP